MDERWHRLLLGAVPVIGLIWAAAFLVFPGFAPLSPRLDAASVAAFFAAPDNAARVRYSMIVFNWFEIGMVPLYATITVLMQRMSHGQGPLPYVYLAATLSGAVMFAAANLFWLVAAYRPDRAPDAMLLLSDLGWVCFIAPTGFLIAQNAALAVAVYLDRRAPAVLPRWVGHFNVVMALCFIPAAFAITTDHGPLAWDGSLAYFLRVIAFAVYIVVMFVATWRAWGKAPAGAIAA